VLTYLSIAHLDPLQIEAVAPEITLAVIRSMRLAAIETPDGVRAWEPLSHRKSGGICIGIPLAAPCKGAIVFLAVRPRAGGAPALWGATG
jgi:hypothetical protein